MATRKKAPAAKAEDKAPAAKAEDKAQAAEVEDKVLTSDAADQEQAGQADDDQAETIKPGKGEVFVLTRKGLPRFFRGGMRFAPEPTVLTKADLPEGVLERLRAEPNLVVVEGD